MMEEGLDWETKTRLETCRPSSPALLLTLGQCSSHLSFQCPIERNNSSCLPTCQSYYTNKTDNLEEYFLPLKFSLKPSVTPVDSIYKFSPLGPHKNLAYLSSRFLYKLCAYLCYSIYHIVTGLMSSPPACAPPCLLYKYLSYINTQKMFGWSEDRKIAWLDAVHICDFCCLCITKFQKFEKYFDIILPTCCYFFLIA